MINFSEVVSVVGSVHHLANELRQEFETEYGFVSTYYQLAVLKNIAERMHRICLDPSEVPPRWMNFETEDPYHEIVSKSMKYY